MRRTTAIVLTLVLATLAFSQDLPLDVGKYVSMIESGQSDKVREVVPALMKKYPNNAGVLYVKGLTTFDGAEAVRVYQSVVDNFPKSQWADAALFKVYQFYYAIGLYRTAELKLTQLRKDYPGSNYIARAAESDTKNLPEEKTPLAKSEDVSATPPTSEPESQPKTEAMPSANKDAEPGTATTLPARMKVPEPPSVKTDAAKPVSGGVGRFRLQVGAFSSQANAEKQRKFLDEQGVKCEIVPSERAGKTLYFVYVGRFSTAEEAKAVAAELKQRNNLITMIVSQ